MTAASFTETQPIEATDIAAVYGLSAGVELTFGAKCPKSLQGGDSDVARVITLIIPPTAR